jgi:hypothetical protein
MFYFSATYLLKIQDKHLFSVDFTLLLVNK